MISYKEVADYLASIAFGSRIADFGDGKIEIHKLTSEMKDLLDASGSYRAVIFDGSIVFKLNWSGSRGDSNRTEWQNYHDLPEELRPYFAKPLYITPDSSVIVMERLPKVLRDTREYDRCEISPVDVENDLVKLFESYMTDEDPFERYLWDVSSSNVGVRDDGSFALIDYASP